MEIQFGKLFDSFIKWSILPTFWDYFPTAKTKVFLQELIMEQRLYFDSFQGLSLS